MFPPGHVGITLVLYSPLAYALLIRGRERMMTAGFFGVLLFTLAPDLDVVASGLTHRGVSHSLAAATCAGLAAGAIGWASGWRSRVRRMERAAMGLFVGAGGVASHLVGDVITPVGIRPFLPTNATVYTLDLVSARDPLANVALFVLGIAAFGGAQQWARVSSVPSEPTPEPSSVDPGTTPR